jgi:hypothetical protein
MGEASWPAMKEEEALRGIATGPDAVVDRHVRAGRDRGAARWLNTPEGKTTEWKSRALPAYQRRTLAADALIASCYLAGTNTRQVRRGLAVPFGGTVGKDTVSRTPAHWPKRRSYGSS